MKIAIFSDVHSNLPTLEAVLTNIKRQRASMQVCLGDIVGNNAEPAECVRRVRQVIVILAERGSKRKSRELAETGRGFKWRAPRGLPRGRRPFSRRRRLESIVSQPYKIQMKAL